MSGTQLHFFSNGVILATDLGRQEESAVQGGSSCEAVEASFRGERQRDIESAPVGTGTHIAGRVHGEACGNARATFPFILHQDVIKKRSVFGVRRIEK